MSSRRYSFRRRSRSNSPFRNRSTLSTTITPTTAFTALTDEATSIAYNSRPDYEVKREKFWEDINKCPPATFDLAKAQKWWFDQDRRLPASNDELRILSEMILSSTLFRNEDQKPITIITRDNNRRVDAKWDATHLRAVIEKSVEDLEANRTSTRHYYLTKNGHDFTSEPTDRCQTPTPEPVLDDDNNVTVVIHSCHLPDEEVAYRDYLKNYTQRFPYDDVKQITERFNDPQSRKPAIPELTLMFLNVNTHLKDQLHRKSELYNERQNHFKNQENWPEEIREHHQRRQQQLLRSIELLTVMTAQDMAKSPDDILHQITTMAGYYSIIEKDGGLQGYLLLDSFRFRTRRDGVQRLCYDWIRKHHQQAEAIQNFIQKYQEETKPPQGTKRTKKINETIVKVYKLSQTQVMDTFDIPEFPEPENHLQPDLQPHPEKCECKNPENAYNAYIRQMDLKIRMERMMKAQDNKIHCRYSNDYGEASCPCLECTDDDKRIKCSIDKCPCKKHTLEALQIAIQNVENNFLNCNHIKQQYEMIKARIVMGSTAAPSIVFQNLVQKYIDSPNDQTSTSSDIYIDSPPVTPIRATHATSEDIDTTDDNESDNYVAQAPYEYEYVTLDDLNAIDSEPLQEIDEKWYQFKCKTERHEEMKKELRIRDRHHPDYVENSTCRRHCNCDTCNATCQCRPEQIPINHSLRNESFITAVFDIASLDKIDEDKYRRAINTDYNTVTPDPEAVYNKLTRTFKRPCRREYIEDLKRTMRLVDQERNYQFCIENTTCSKYCSCKKCRNKCTCVNDRMTKLRHNKYQQIIFRPKTNDFEYWNALHVLLIKKQDEELAKNREEDELRVQQQVAAYNRYKQERMLEIEKSKLSPSILSNEFTSPIKDYSE